MNKTGIFCLILLKTILLLYNVTESRAQRNITFLSINDSYPFLMFENKTLFGNRNCKCDQQAEANAWGPWSECSGDANKNFFNCHHGLRFRLRDCPSFGFTETCNVREWRYCYHAASCKGQWVEWVNQTDAQECSRTCGGGVRPRIKICMLGNDFGMYCASLYRRPFKVDYEMCNNQTCESTTTVRIASAGPFEVNTLSWILLAMLVVLVLLVCVLSLVLTCTCARKRVPKKQRSVHQHEHQMNNVAPTSQPTSPQYNHLQNDHDFNTVPARRPPKPSTSATTLPLPAPRQHSALQSPTTSSLPRQQYPLPTTSKQPKSNGSSLGGTPRRYVPDPPAVTNHSLAPNSNVRATADFIAVDPGIEAATYYEDDPAGYLQSMPPVDKPRGKRSETGNALRPAGNAFADSGGLHADSSHLYSEIPVPR